ncbi:MAG: NifU family protein [Candidatus Omnitrophota bacterium]
MDIRLMIQSTPNPNALKFVLNIPVKKEGNFTYKKNGACEHNPLAKGIFELSPAINEVYFYDNYITVTQDGSADWDDLEEKIRATIMEKAKDHNPEFQVEENKVESKAPAQSSPEMEQINSILDQTVRPALQMDGGDIQLTSYENNVLRVFYQGACGSCPSSSMGTMKAIENILKDQFNPEITVELAEMY